MAAALLKVQLVLNTLRLSSAAAGGPAAHAGHWSAPPCAGTSSEYQVAFSA